VTRERRAPGRRIRAAVGATDSLIVRTSDVDNAKAGALRPPPAIGGQADGDEPGRREAAGPGEWRDVAVMFREHHADLVRLALLLVGDRASAEDVVQDVFTRLCVRDRELQPDRALAYIRTGVVNACRSVLRRRALGRRIATTRAALWPDTQESAEHTVILAEDRRRVMQALAALPSRRREVLVLRFYLNLSVAEVAQVLGISQGSVKSAAARGLAALGRQLGEER
jgi:RNA polymerase sigma-70 factor (sigma-E family)